MIGKWVVWSMAALAGLGIAASGCEREPSAATAGDATAIDAVETADADDMGSTFDAWVPDTPHQDIDAQLGPCTSAEPLCQKYLGRRWSDKVNLLTYAQAAAHCAGLGARLPTISELRTLIVECPATAPGGPCGVTDQCTSYATCYAPAPCIGCGDGGLSVFKDEEPFWSSTPNSDQAGQQWIVAFRYNLVSTRAAATAGPSVYCTAVD